MCDTIPGSIIPLIGRYCLFCGGDPLVNMIKTKTYLNLVESINKLPLLNEPYNVWILNTVQKLPWQSFLHYLFTSWKSNLENHKTNKYTECLKQYQHIGHIWENSIWLANVWKFLEKSLQNFHDPKFVGEKNSVFLELEDII